MASGSHNNSPSPLDIPLQDLPSTTRHVGFNDAGHDGTEPLTRTRSLLTGSHLGAEIGRRLSHHRKRSSYDRISPEPPRNNSTPPPTTEVPDLQIPTSYNDPVDDIITQTQVQNEINAALGVGVGRGSWLPPRRNTYDGRISYDGYNDDNRGRMSRRESSASPLPSPTDEDFAPLTLNSQPMAGFRPENKRSVSSYGPGQSLGDDLLAAEEGLGRSSSKNSTKSLRSGSPASKSGSRLSPGASPVRRVSVALQNMSQRVVNLSNDPEAVEQTLRRRASKQSRATSSGRDTLAPGDERPPMLPRKLSGKSEKIPWREQANPLKGNSLRIFSPQSRIRLILCDVLIHPFTEPLILLLIFVQTILLTIDASPSAHDDSRAKRWGTSPIDYALLVLFSIYTLEIIARCIVSGVFMNPVQANDPDARGGLRRKIIKKARTFFLPKRPEMEIHRANSPMRMEFEDHLKDPNDGLHNPTIVRAFTAMNMGDNAAAGGPGQSFQSQARFRLARRAFLRHSFNRLDFVAVVSYWISLGLCLSGLEAEKHLYVFRMMSCLRILRLLGITSGTSVILRSLKKAAPLLVHVAFLIGFFWIIFGIIGVQSFKGSLQRNCVWVDPAGIQDNYTQSMQFCGGYMDPITGEKLPYRNLDGSFGASQPKGYICPMNSYCVAVGNPYGGTVSFDNIVQSLELVFVVMTANTFSDLLYYTADSDYLAAACFFIAGIVILAFWLANLLIAVITSSFQVIREESSKSAFSADDRSSIHQDKNKTQRPESTIQKFYRRSHHFWVIVIATGLFAQMFRSSTMPPGRGKLLDKVEFVITLVLLFEIIVRFMSDWRKFHKKHRNWVDLLLVVITCIMLLPSVHRNAKAYAWLTIFQILRVYRLVWAIPVTRNLLSKVLGNVTGLSNLIFFVILLTFLCALFAVQIVRGDIPSELDGEVLPITFHTCFNAFLGMYQIFSSENWTSILYTATQVQSPFGVGWISAMFFIGWFILGNFIVLNMFIAVIQENFDVTEDEKRMEQVKAFLQNKSYKAPSQGLQLSSLFSRKKKQLEENQHSRQYAFEMLTKQAIVESFLDEGEQHKRASVTKGLNKDAAAAIANLTQQEEKRQRFFQRWYAKLKEMWKDRENNPFYSFQSKSVADLAPTALAQEVVTEEVRRRKAQREYLAKHPNYNTSLFIFKPTNPIRRMCQRMVGPSRGNSRPDGKLPDTVASYCFSLLIYCAIVAMVVLACITTPLYQKEYFERNGRSNRNWFTLVDAGFAVLFTLESGVKIIADGLVWTPNAYLRGSWGIIDCIVLITLWISVASSLTNKDEISRAVGAFKALRALRLLNISGTAQDTFHSVVIIGGKKILSAAFVSLSLIIPFAIYGVNLFAGQMDACNDGDGITNLTECIHEYASSPYQWDVLAPRVVERPYFNFDNFGTSLFILFQIVSQEGWTGVMFQAQNIVGKGMQPQPFFNEWNAIFFLAFNLLGAVFVLTLFVSVFMRNYTEQTGVAFLTSDQRTWLELRKLLRQVRPSKRPNERPNSQWKSWCYQRSTHKHGYWQRAITTLLMIHGILLLLEYHPSPKYLDRTRDWFFLVLDAAFIINLVVRIIGLTWKNFVKSKWDLYAMLTVGGTFVTTLLLLFGYAAPMFVQLQKLFLVSIVLLLIPRNDQLDHLFKTAAASLTAIGNLIATWFVLFLVYAIALTQTFGLTKIGPSSNGNMNFRTVPKALILLFRMTCGEGWNEIMSDYEIHEPACVHGPTFFDSDCGSQVYANALFVSWNILSMYIFVSMFISLIFESFSYVYQRSGDSSQVSREEIRKFKQAWAKLDPDGDGYIPKDKFPRLLGLLSGIFAMRIYEEPFTVSAILKEARPDPNAFLRPRKARIVEGVDLDILNKIIAKIPTEEIRRRRYTFTVFFEECLVSADKDYGVSFESVLLILAHYKIINDNKSLRLEEYLRRRYRLQRVEEQVQRNVVTNFFLTLYWSRRFKELHAGRLTPDQSRRPSPSIPTILVDSASEIGIRPDVPEIRLDTSNIDIPEITLNSGDDGGPFTPPNMSARNSLDVAEASGYSPIDSPTGNIAFGFAGINPFADDGIRQRGPGRRTPPWGGSTPNLSPSASPMISPTTSIRAPEMGAGLWYGGLGGSEEGQRERENSEVAPGMLDASALTGDNEWRSSINRYIEQSGMSRSNSQQSDKVGPLDKSPGERSSRDR